MHVKETGARSSPLNLCRALEVITLVDVCDSARERSTERSFKDVQNDDLKLYSALETGVPDRCVSSLGQQWLTPSMSSKVRTTTYLSLAVMPSL